MIIHVAGEVISTDAYDPRKHPHAPKGSSKGGQFTKTGGGGSTITTKAEKAPPVIKTTKRAFTGEPKNTRKKLGKQETGKVGEEIAISYLQHHLKIRNARQVTEKRGNFPVDLIAGDTVYEVKTGQVSVTRKAQQWRATIGQPGPAEQEYLDSLSPSELRAHNADKNAAIMARKEWARQYVSRVVGKRLKTKTITLIVDPDRNVADIFEFDGFHKRIDYNSREADKGYVGTFQYKPKKGGDETSRMGRDQRQPRSVDIGLHQRVAGLVFWLHER